MLSLARDGDTVSGTVSEIRRGMMLVSLHDASGRDVPILLGELKRHTDYPRIGDRFEFGLHIDAKSGELTATRVSYLPQGQTINDR